jgi:hypothetical protein
MHIAELTQPGAWLDYADREWCQRVEGLLSGLESSLANVAVALMLFEKEMARPRRRPSMSERDADYARERAIESELGKAAGLNPESLFHDDAIRLQARIALKREKWAAGELPREYEHSLVFMHARSFVYALDRLRKLLKALLELPDVPDAVRAAEGDLLMAFPSLVGVRDSVAHFEDRSRGLGRDKKPLELGSVDNEIMKADGGVLLLENLIDNRFTTAMADGSQGEVEISLKSLQAAQRAVQATLDSFRWRGEPRHMPGY